MKKKTLCGLLTAAVVLGVCPSAAFAADDFTAITDNTLDFRGVYEDRTGDGWAWKGNAQILTLEDCRIEVPHSTLEEKAAIYLPDESTIKIKGDNNEIQVHSYGCDAIYAEGELWVEGDGNLKIKTDSLSASAFYVENGPISFDEEVEVTVDPKGYIIYVDDASGDKAIISVLNDAKVSFPEKAKERNILVTHKNSVKPFSSWLNYVEQECEEDDKYIDLVKKPVIVAEEETPIEEDTSDKDVYQITIGNPGIVKNGSVSYRADVAPYLKNGYTMLPLRALLAVSDPDLKVNWNEALFTAHTFIGNEFVTIKPNEPYYTKAENKIKLSTPAELKDRRLFISLRDWMEIMDIPESRLEWNSETQTVTLKY